MITVDGKKMPWLLETIEDSHPYAVVRINDKYISKPDFHTTTIPDQSEIFLIPMIAGG